MTPLWRDDQFEDELERLFAVLHLKHAFDLRQCNFMTNLALYQCGVPLYKLFEPQNSGLRANLFYGRDGDHWWFRCYFGILRETSEKIPPTPLFAEYMALTQNALTSYEAFLAWQNHAQWLLQLITDEYYATSRGVPWKIDEIWQPIT